MQKSGQRKYEVTGHVQNELERNHRGQIDSSRESNTSDLLR